MEIRKLNSLRGLAALIVLISHYSNETNLYGGIFGHGAGQLGVMLFFLLSSFLMAYLYLEKAPTLLAIRDYFVARIARVIPLFIGVVISSFLLQETRLISVSKLIYSIDSIRSLISHLLLLSGTNVLWTIPPEIHFYIIFALVWYLRPRFWRIITFGSALVLVLYAIGVWPGRIILNTIFDLPVYFSTMMALPYFIIGSLFGYAYRHWHPPVWLCTPWFVTALLFLPLLFPEIYILSSGHAHGMWSDIMILSCISTIFFTVVFLVPSNNLLLENRIGDKIGEISYSLYLLHYPLLLLMKSWGITNGIFGLFIFMTLSLVLALLSFYLLEDPTRLKIRALYLSKQ